MVSRDDEFLPSTTAGKQLYSMKAKKGKENIIHVNPAQGWGTAPATRGNSQKGNCRYIILANRIKSNKPSVITTFPSIKSHENNDH